MATESMTSDTKRDVRRLVILGAIALAVIYLVLLVVMNTATVSISFVFFEAEVPLVVALTLAGVLGAAIGAGTLAVLHRR